VPESRRQVAMIKRLTSNTPIYIVCFFLAAVTFAVFWQVRLHEFVYFDDGIYVTQNPHIQSGLAFKEIAWAFTTTYAEFWHPVTWLSLMADDQLYGLSPGGYHLTNLLIHIMSALLLFWLFNRMTGALWQSAFIAAMFALHPLRVESVAWVAERKDVLSAFFWMLTLCFYVYYAEKPVLRRYCLVVLCFVCGLMSKSMVVTLPLIMLLLDYWPLNRFRPDGPSIAAGKVAGIVPGWQLREKVPLFALSAIFSVITIYAQEGKTDVYPLASRLANAPVSFMTYLEKTFWPRDMALVYIFPEHLPAWQVLSAVFLIVLISAVVVYLLKRRPYLFTGWLWYVIAVLPVIGLITIGDPMADRYIYLPSIGISVMVAWGVPLLFPGQKARKFILLPSAVIFLAVLSVIAWKQCTYWKNNAVLADHAFQVTGSDVLLIMMHNNLAASLEQEGRLTEAIEHYNEAIRLKPDYAYAYNQRGTLYAKLGQHRQAITDFSEAIRLQPDYALAFNNRGNIYVVTGEYLLAIENYNTAIRLMPDYAYAYGNRGFAYLETGNGEQGCRDVRRACELGSCKGYTAAKSRGLCH